MKYIITLILSCILLSANAQKYEKELVYNPPKGWLSPELYVPSVILITTFGTNEYLGKSVSYGTRSSIALTGISTSIVTHFLLRKIRTKKSNKRIILKY